jgi:cathepsin A (carboxypeptidase C)
VPSIAHQINTQNKALRERQSNGEDVTDKFIIPLKGIAVGNGLTNTEEQYKWYPDMGLDGGKKYGGTLEKGVLTNPLAQAIMRGGVIPCVKTIQACNAGSSEACAGAFVLCNYAEQIPYQLTGMNPYDMRIKCEVPPLCYNFSGMNKWLNQADVQAALGVNKQWQDCNMLVNKMFMTDFMRSFHTYIPDLLASDVQVLIYAGDVDYICNWLGNKMWTLKLEWPGKEAFNQAEDKPYMVNGKEAGKVRSSGGFHFMQVYQAGHMVPMDQPEAADLMIRQFTQGKSFAPDGAIVQAPQEEVFI